MVLVYSLSKFLYWVTPFACYVANQKHYKDW